MTIDLIQHDLKQRQLALDANKSFIVQAPAGSGKTELLIQRLLTLLTTVNSPEEILAITFTKKAANEMRERVINVLQDALDVSEPASPHKLKTRQLAQRVLARDQQLNWQILVNPNQLRIQTIDAFCTHLTNQLPLLSYFGSQPAIADMPDYLYQEAAQEVLNLIEEDHEWSSSIANILLHLDNDLNKLSQLIVSLLKKRDQWLPLIHHNNTEIELKVKLEDDLAQIIQLHLKTLKDVFPREILNELLPIIRFAAANLKLTDAGNEKIAVCENLTTTPETSTDDLIYWQGLGNLLLTKKHAWRKRVDTEIGFPALNSLKNPNEKIIHSQFRQQLSDVIEKLSAKENIRLQFEKLSLLPDINIPDDQFIILNDLIQLLKIATAQLRIVFQRSGKIDFIENALAAITALGTDEHPTDLALALDYQIQHVLIDEFQDTSSTQYTLIKKLTQGWADNDGRTLFIVGDPMQSIYRFREAEVGLFLRLYQHGFGSICLHPIKLTVNFRSTANIVEWNNRHFNDIFPQYADINSGAVNYSSSIAATADIEEKHTWVNISAFNANDDKAQAEFIAHSVKELMTARPQQSIAILVRARTHVKTIIAALQRAAIPYQAVDIDPLSSRQTIQDLLSLSRALLHPADRIAWLAVLRAPWCGLTLHDLHVIAGQTAHQTIWELLNNAELISQTSSDGQTRIKKLLAILKISMQARERRSLRDWIESTWLLLGGPACLTNTNDIDDANTYFNLLNDINFGIDDISLEKLNDKINQSYAASLNHKHAVQIMTIHSAKGLEFDTVFLPALNRKMPPNDKPLLAWMEQPLTNGDMALLLSPIHATGNDKDKIYEYIQSQQKTKLDYETDRLLYVAATRAKQRLILSFTIEQTGDNVRIDSSSFLAKLWPHIQHAAKFKENNASNPEEISSPTTHTIQRLASSWENPIAMNHTASTIHNRFSGFKQPNHTPRIIGIIIHKIFQLLCKNNITWWTSQSIDSHTRYIQKIALNNGLVNHADSTVPIILNAVNNMLTDSRGQWILQPHRDAQVEYMLTAILDNKIEQLVVDRTFIDEHGCRWIIDYKTSIPDDDDIDSFLLEETQQYQTQLRRYAQAFKLLGEDNIKCGLYFPLLPKWIEVAL